MSRAMKVDAPELGRPGEHGPNPAATSDDATDLAISIVEKLACSGVVRSSVPWEDVCEIIEPAILAHLADVLPVRPAETAPKDGSEIVLSDGRSSWAGFWDDNSEGLRGGPGFYAESDRGSLLTARNTPATLWCPLPQLIAGRSRP